MNRVKLNVRTRPPIVSPPDKEYCGICKRQRANYTCPKCNVQYCSLACFKAGAHNECSEAFYRREVEDEIKNASNRSADERRKMMALLRRFEEQSSQNCEDLQEDEDEDDLSQKLQGIDLDKTDVNTIWPLLSPFQRDTFTKAMRDPTSELAQQLLASEELQKTHRRPWWIASMTDGDEVETGKFGQPPNMMNIPDNLPSIATSAPIIYNVLALCVAYAYVTRKLFISPLYSLETEDPDRTVAQGILAGMLPYLTDRRSTFLLKSVDDMVTFLWAKLDALQDLPTNETFSVLLSDTYILFKPNPITVVTEFESDSLPSRWSLLAISDVASLFAPLPKMEHVMHKLSFYGAHIIGQNSERIKAVAEESRLMSLKLKSETLENAEIV